MNEIEKIWTVSELTSSIKELLEESFYPFWMSGEIGNLTIHRSGHVYFTLKDKKSQISGVFFGGAEIAREMKLTEGAEVEVHGKLMVYEPRGNYQINVKMMRAKGLGELQREFELLKKRLRSEGLFDENRKKPLPFLPRTIGVVTSPDGAALRDFLQIIGRRFANAHIRIYPAAVQGPKAAPEIADGIRYFNEHRAVEVIIITRGGGSLEDLWAFNEEVVARAISDSEIPIISAVGHEVDFTISDFVADVRVPTPSAAAELVLSQKTELLQHLVNLRKRSITSVHLKLSIVRARVDRIANHYVLREPLNLVRIHQQKLDELNLRLHRVPAKTLERLRDRLNYLKNQLRTLSPASILDRGYSILLSQSTGKPVTRVGDTSSGELLLGQLADGRLNLRVEDSPD